MLFLEKIADLFEAMASILPPYHQIFAICKRRLSDAQAHVEDKSLAALMSYVYLDILQLLLDTYGLFFRDLQGTFQAPSML
jgi:hypothetical protein